ncbi:sphinganine c-4-hydroxylase [Hanseniaspora valbyensis NRRL Y-1626]|uniref:Sphinganine c-4-hydroxylase n=1 Tax=Hanseniaspora valbyensis NRRL Y-1626 TaxID=766949 RepID=A0A1B7TE71_9ASCO|nr:sphinganine c-4-hydroxylase [Hanseniaspora valbyensis NRRL Y-1626]
MNSTVSSQFPVWFLNQYPKGLEVLSSHVPPAAQVNLSGKDLIDNRSIYPNLPDGILALISPVVAYWAFSLFFHIIDTFKLAEYYRIHPSEEVVKRNRASRLQVLVEVIFQHIIQSVVGYVFYIYDDFSPKTYLTIYSEIWSWKYESILFKYVNSFLPNWFYLFWYCYGISFFKIFIGFVIIDSWQYWLHRLMHQNKTLYRLFHSRHHSLYIPYAYGALFNQPVEGFLLDTLGTGIAMLVTQLSPKEQVILYTFATMKTVDDHCGYCLPFDLFQVIFPNNSVFHDIHHQNWGIKTNFAQPFFITWDTWCGTEYPGYEEYRKGVMKVSIEKYKSFLTERKAKKMDKTDSGKSE